VNRGFNFAKLRLGIIGGGQLGRLIALEAKRMGLFVTILDPDQNAPAAQIADRQIVADLYSNAGLDALVSQSDVTTFEIEHVDTTTLQNLAERGHTIHPSPQLMQQIQNKYVQKRLLQQHGIAVPELHDVVDVEDIALLGFPVVQKAKLGGYDGRGVVVLKSRADLDKRLDGESFIEQAVAIDKELAVMVARNAQGEIRCYPVAEMLFDERVNICDSVIVPARIPDAIAANATAIARRAIEVLQGVGIFGVELFLTTDGTILINEIAPRPHNSGHYTLEACATSQFEQIIRAVADLPLGSTRLYAPAVMVNLLGEQGYSGKPVLEGVDAALAIDEVTLHLYGKAVTRPFRKMGHITVLGETVAEALARAMQAKELIKVKGDQPL
jgi:5-(carboxyamino)imidazole ribonucleotide synthase